jgi:CheY-like chemotaxis protein
MDAHDSAQQGDIIFLDLEMPGMNGYEVLAEFLTVSAYDSVPIVAYQSHERCV